MGKKLGKTQKGAWVTLLLAYGSLFRELDERMAKAGVVPMDVYDILFTLEESPDQRLKMSDLAACALMTRSGLTRLVDRLEKEGLVKRLACATDRRAVHAALTDKGLAERERAWPAYEEALQELFGSKLTNDEAEMIMHTLKRFVTVPHPILTSAHCDKLP